MESESSSLKISSKTCITIELSNVDGTSPLNNLVGAEIHLDESKLDRFYDLITEFEDEAEGRDFLRSTQEIIPIVNFVDGSEMEKLKQSLLADVHPSLLKPFSTPAKKRRSVRDSPFYVPSVSRDSETEQCCYGSRRIQCCRWAEPGHLYCDHHIRVVCMKHEDKKRRKYLKRTLSQSGILDEPGEVDYLGV